MLPWVPTRPRCKVETRQTGMPCPATSRCLTHMGQGCAEV